MSVVALVVGLGRSDLVSQSDHHRWVVLVPYFQVAEEFATGDAVLLLDQKVAEPAAGLAYSAVPPGFAQGSEVQTAAQVEALDPLAVA